VEAVGVTDGALEGLTGGLVRDLAGAFGLGDVLVGAAVGAPDGRTAARRDGGAVGRTARRSAAPAVGLAAARFASQVWGAGVVPEDGEAARVVVPATAGAEATITGAVAMISVAAAAAAAGILSHAWGAMSTASTRHPPP